MEPAFERAYPGTNKATKRHILSCALKCFDEGRFEAVTIEEIREKSGSSTGTIYHHFGSKEGLAAAIYFAALDDQQASFKVALLKTSSVREALKAWVSVYVEWIVGNPRLARFMFESRKSISTGARKEQLKERNEVRYGALNKFLLIAVEAGLIRSLPAETYPSLLIGQSENYCRAWLSGRVTTSPLEHIDVFADAAWRSIAVAPGADA
ncbi:hypothetical protein MARI_31280 [Marinobacter sp. JH2]|nr:TetR/AcrR family transcriptional regulator [Marinobacter sp. JH2]QBM18985.1 hypothetical protein MARI_31280 [Marinobacter sp. JH2]